MPAGFAELVLPPETPLANYTTARFGRVGMGGRAGGEIGGQAGGRAGGWVGGGWAGRQVGGWAGGQVGGWVGGCLPMEGQRSQASGRVNQLVMLMGTCSACFPTLHTQTDFTKGIGP